MKRPNFLIETLLGLFVAIYAIVFAAVFSGLFAFGGIVFVITDLYYLIVELFIPFYPLIALLGFNILNLFRKKPVEPRSLDGWTMGWGLLSSLLLYSKFGYDRYEPIVIGVSNFELHTYIASEHAPTILLPTLFSYASQTPLSRCWRKSCRDCTEPSEVFTTGTAILCPSRLPPHSAPIRSTC